MNTILFGEIKLLIKGNLWGILEYEWKNFKRYAKDNFEYLKITHLSNFNFDEQTEIILYLSNNNSIKFKNLIVEKNLIKFIQDNGYNQFVNKIKLVNDIYQHDHAIRHNNILHHMTPNEINKILTLSFDELFNDLWNMHANQYMDSFMNDSNVDEIHIEI